VKRGARAQQLPACLGRLCPTTALRKVLPSGFGSRWSRFGIRRFGGGLGVIGEMIGGLFVGGADGFAPVICAEALMYSSWARGRAWTRVWPR